MKNRSKYINDSKWFSKKFSFMEIFLPLFYILCQYNLPVSSVGFTILFGYCGILLFKKKRICFHKWMLILLLYLVANQCIIYTLTDTWKPGNVSSFFFMILSILAVFILSDSMKMDRLFYAYAIIGTICIMVLMFQAVKIYAMGQAAHPIRLFPVPSSDLHFWYAGGDRPSSFFAEPQAFASYILPLLCLSLIKGRLIFALFVSFSILLSTSSQGIILCAIMWVIYFVFYLRNNIVRLLLLAGGLIASITLFALPIFQETVQKILSINLTYDIRLTRGFSIWGELPLATKIVGLGYGNVRDFLLSGKADLFWIPLTRPELLDYTTTMSGMLIYYGLIGFLIFLLLFIFSLSGDAPQGRMFLLVIFIACFVQGMIFNAWFVFYWIFYMNLTDKNQYPQNYWILDISTTRLNVKP